METTSGDHAEVRGRVQHVVGGEVQYFRTWRESSHLFNGILQELEEFRSQLSDTQ
ncbi:MAG: hypothetical protein R2911_10940 [Caldilineaceae bacterium]